MNYLTKYISFLVFGLTISFLSCSNSADILFSVSTEYDKTIEGGKNTSETHFWQTNNIPTFYSNFQMNSGYLDESVGVIFPDKATISSKFGDDLDFIHSVTIWVYDTNYDQGTEIFYLENIDLGSKTEIKLLSGITDVAPWIKNEKVLIDLRIRFRQLKAASTDLRITMDFAAFEAE